MTHSHLKKLASLYSKEGDIVTAVLPARIADKKDEAIFNNTLKQLKAAHLAAEIEALEVFFEDSVDGKYQSICVVSANGAETFIVYPVEIHLEPHVHIGHIVDLTPLIKLEDDYRKAAFVRIEKEQCEVSLFHIGELLSLKPKERTETQKGDTVHRSHKKGGWSQGRFQRHIDHQVKRNIKDAADHIQKLHQKHSFEYILISGAGEQAHTLESELGKPVTDTATLCIVSATSKDGINYTEVSEVIKTMELEREVEAMNAIIKKSADQSRVVFGINNAFTHLKDNKLQALMLHEAAEFNGFLCLGDEMAHLGTKNADCETAMVSIKNIVPLLLRRAVLSGVDIEFIDSDVLMEHRGVCGILRY